jgi:peptidoglycan hydrolase-like protein with peptidoglycan-binding domain
VTLGTDASASVADGDAGRRPAIPPERRRRRGWAVGMVVVVVLVAGGGAAYRVYQTQHRGIPTRGNTLPQATAPITRGDVIDTESVDGRLTYPNSRAITAGGGGVVTQTPIEGSIVNQGQALYMVANRPVVLMYGKLPLYRDLSDGVSNGPDVKQLEADLKALGYGDGLIVDNHFSAATARAVENWQDDRGLKKTGQIDASQLVFETGAVRVGDVATQVGQRLAPGSPVLAVTDSQPIVHIDLDAAKQSLAKKGETVKVELPNGNTVSGRVSTVDTVAKATGSGDNQTSTVDVDVTVSSGDTGGLDQAPVTVDMENARAQNVLSVPIEALLGLREGGFGIELVEGGTSRIVPVKIGTFGAGRVEISGAGVREGMSVGVPSS